MNKTVLRCPRCERRILKVESCKELSIECPNCKEEILLNITISGKTVIKIREPASSK